MEFDGDLDRQQRIIGMAGTALTLVRKQDEGALQPALVDFLAESPNPAADLRLLTFLVVRECATLAGTRIAQNRRRDPDTGTVQFRIEVATQQDEPLAIDELPPPLRTVLRTILAEGYGDPRAADELVEIALHEASPEELNFLLSAGLSFTVQIAEECHRRGIATPEWVRAALDD